MANSANNNGSVLKGIKNSWSLLAFAQSHGKMQVGSFETVDQQTGEIKKFKSCVFTDPTNSDEKTNKTFVSFSSRLGELTPREISEQKDNLQVAELESGHYSLCRKGNNAWEDVDLF